ncbi:SgcJ/EcaC family oxidoreductase [bacterium]|nr:SgcJ/EcaC family oxidoreductase [bacterium]
MRHKVHLSLFVLLMISILVPAQAQTGLKSGTDSSKTDLDPSLLSRAVEEATEDIDVMNARWVHAFRTQDAEKAAALFDRDGALLGEHGSITFGSKQIHEAMKRWMKQLGPAQVSFERSDLWRLDPYAYETGYFTYSWTSGDEDIEHHSTGVFLTIWKLQEDGSWRIHRSIPLPEE